ncbi:MAG: hypothetical protein RLZZ585_811 [Bacteroidota bacterium]|jgi:hypothetical protein
MKNFICIVGLLFSSQLFSQGGFVKSEKKGNDYMVVSNHGIQFSIGPTYSFHTKPILGDLTTLNGARGNYSITPESKLGFYAEFGMVHFPKWKGTPIKALKKSRVIDYFDWGIGFSLIRGTEETEITYKNAFGDVISTQNEFGQMKNGYLYGRYSAHSLIYFGKKKIVKVRKHFVDNSIGIQFAYCASTYDTTYSNYFYPIFATRNYQGLTEEKLAAQFVYSLGVGIRLNKAWMFVPSVTIPIVTVKNWDGFNAYFDWHSSGYWPIQAQVKFIKLFEKPNKCGVYSTPEDKEMQKQYEMQ